MAEPGTSSDTGQDPALAWPPRNKHELEAICAALCGDAPAATLDDRALRAAILAGQDPIGEAFCSLEPPAERRKRGAFYTPQPLADAMAAWVLERTPCRVADLGSGSGRFAVALRRAGFQGQLLAVDADPLAVLMTRAHLAAAGLPPAEVVCADLLQLRLPAVVGRTAFIGNPPYVRHHDLTRETKAWAQRAGGQLGVKLSGLAGLHVLFVLAAALASRPGDLGCLLTSAEWLDVGYGAAIRQLLAGPLGLRFLDLLAPEAVHFSDAMSTALLFGWEQGSRGPSRLRQADQASQLGALGTGRAVSHQALAAAPRWSALCRAPPAARRQDMVPLSTYGRVHRGVATGANAFFSLPVAEVRRLGLQAHFMPCLTRAAQVQGSGGVVTAGHCTHQLLVLDSELPECQALRAYLAKGEEQGVPKRYLCSHRKPWWRVGGPPPAPIVVTYMARRPPAFAANPDGCRILNVLHGLHLHEGQPPWLAQALLRWLRTHADGLQGARTYHGGLRKWEPRELEAVDVPGLAALERLAAVR